jgi:hypothetical protein
MVVLTIVGSDPFHLSNPVVAGDPDKQIKLRRR